MVRVRRVRVGRDSTVRDRVQIRVSSSSKILQWDKFCNASNYAPHQHKGSNRLLSRVWWHTKWDKDSLCHDIRKSHITRLQQIHNSPACAVKSSHNNTTILCSFCWLKITEHTEYKLLSHTKSSQPRNVVTSRMTSCDLTHDLMWPHAWPHVTSRMTSCDLTHDLMWPHAWPHVTSRMTSRDLTHDLTWPHAWPHLCSTFSSSVVTATNVILPMNDWSFLSIRSSVWNQLRASLLIPVSVSLSHLFTRLSRHPPLLFHTLFIHDSFALSLPT